MIAIAILPVLVLLAILAPRFLYWALGAAAVLMATTGAGYLLARAASSMTAKEILFTLTAGALAFVFVKWRRSRRSAEADPEVERAPVDIRK